VTARTDAEAAGREEVGTRPSDATGTPNGGAARSARHDPRPTSPPSRAGSAPRAAPTSPSVRRFLRPLVGIDPDTVRIQRDDDAAQLAAARGADAIAAGDTITLASGHDERDPDTVALIAHELTHVARAREPRFVPPIARGSWAPPGASVPRASAVRGVDPDQSAAAPPPDDEELMARVVEARVRDAAMRERAVDVSTFVETAGDRPMDDVAIGESPVAGHRHERHEAPDAPMKSAPWGALPAPWQPLPEFVTRARSAGSLHTAASPPENGDSSDVTASVTSTVDARFAEHGLGSTGEEPAHAEAPGDSDADGAPDIDALARQVYAVLRRRLAAERRRGA
jgi:hypothetical protein